MYFITLEGIPHHTQKKLVTQLSLFFLPLPLVFDIKTTKKKTNGTHESTDFWFFSEDHFKNKFFFFDFILQGIRQTRLSMSQ
jgi:hypothetical protein